MPVTPLITAGIEQALNRFLYQDQALRAARQRLNGKVLRVTLNEFSAPLILVFSERQVDVLGQWEGEADCSLSTRLEVLPKLRDRQLLASLIKQGDLDVQGDIQVLQHFAALLDQADFDPAELLAPYTGDIIAEGASKVMRGGLRLMTSAMKRNQRYFAEAVTEEWRLAPPPLEQAWFAEEVSALERETDALQKRLERLEAK
ncbi:SCP2 domain-containing protein [Salmonella enterica subsp. enterica serovar Choleraesuis]|nr:SCP2 domain-containing protein [Salmonella enterica subsp. enterica serovar Choleraesuis]